MKNSDCVGIDLSNPAQAVKIPECIQLSTARNSWTQFVVQLNIPATSVHAQLSLPRFQNGIAFKAYQILSAPVDLNEAEYVRVVGSANLPATEPRVLLPMPMNGNNVNLSRIQISKNPVLIWIDVHIDANVDPGDFHGNIELFGSSSAAGLPLKLTVENLMLPKALHLHIAAPLGWSALSRQYSDLFEKVPPRLLARSDPRRQKLIELLESYLQLAHENNADFFLPQLQPIVKWPLGKAPDIDWTDFDSVVGPWLNGSAFADGRPIGFWPLPGTDLLDQINLAARIQFWKLAHRHFVKKQWTHFSPVVLNRTPDGVASPKAWLLLTASEILQGDPDLLVICPIKDEQEKSWAPQNPGPLGPPARSALSFDPRIIFSAPGFVVQVPNSGSQKANTVQLLETADYSPAAFTEQSMRLLAFHAFAHEASLILCDDPMAPMTGSAAAHQIVWTYRGETFGVDHPLATIQLKWLRQLEQDYEYLLLSRQHNSDTLKICELVTQPVERAFNLPDESLLNLFAGSTDSNACERARLLLVSQMQRNPNNAVREQTSLTTIRWLAEYEKQTIAANSVDWKWNLNDSRIEATAGVMIYNAAAQMPTGGRVRWVGSENGWDSSSASVPVEPIERFHVTTAAVTARFDPAKMSATGAPAEIQYTDDFTGQSANCQAVLPVAVSQRRHAPLVLDGNLDDWYPADGVQLNQPLVDMLNQTSLRAGALVRSATLSSIYTAWSDENLYLAFRLGGVIASDLRSTRNFVQYDHGRAWGEDLCELLVRPIYVDNFVGPLLHVVCKPGGSWVEQQNTDQSWQPFEASGLRYASGVDPAQKIWRGELAVPWKAINAAGHGRPSLLRFNFIQHKQENGESASWAGPIDQSRDGKLSGLLLIKD